MRTNALLILGVVAAMGGGCGDDVPSNPDAPSGPQCSDGVDNDGDGLVDYPDDLGCSDANDDTEDSTPQPQCDDGRDNDGDGKTDYPADPGCFASLADSEEDDCPSGPSCPQCANGIDDDGNGKTDYPDDSGCMSASDAFEFTENPVACGANLMIKNLPPTGMEEGMLATTSTSELVPSCGGVAGAPAIAYQLNLTEPKVVVASTNGSTADTVLVVRSANCTDEDAELACNDNISTSNKSSSITVSLAAGNYYLIVSGATANAVGAYTLDVAFFTGEGETCVATEECGPGLVCRTPVGETEMQCAQPVCSDGLDDDGDGKIDFPHDPGCTSPTDDDEADDCPAGTSCPACGNGVDDDEDGLTDYPDDPSCSSASGSSESCMTTEGVVAIVAPMTTGTTVGQTNDTTPSCGSSSHSAPDMMYQLTVPALSSLSILNDNNFDAAVALFDASCTGASLVCQDSPEDLTLTNVAAGTYYYLVDGWSSATGTYTITVSGTIQPGGRCDPEVTLGGALACPATNPCEGTPGDMRCRPTQCSDGVDNDGDGKMDFPHDPGCTALADDDETDDCPDGASCPECGNGVDDDMDGLTDYPEDPNCSSASGNAESCATTEGVTEIVSPTTTGTTVGQTNDTRPACGSTSSHSAPDLMYSLNLPHVTSLTINNSHSFDAAVALYDASCAGAALKCQDEPENLSFTDLDAGTYFYLVDGWGSGTGSFTVTVSGTIANGGSCEVPLAQSGALTCATGYSCKGAMGSRTCQPAQCSDGVDNDGDGKTDFPDEPGCTSIADDDETDDCPSGASCPVCSNEIDDDMDGHTDYPNDPSCAAASGSSEACLSADGVSELVAPVTTGATTGASNDSTPACGSSSNSAPDHMYSLRVPNLTSLRINNENSFDAVVALYDASCGGTALQCNDTPEHLTFGALSAGTYYYLIDGYGSGSGTYTITVSGTIAAGESCESPLAQSGALTCSPGYGCTGPAGSRTCQPVACADGIDNDGDGLADFPFDPGCESYSDDDETDPATPPVCSNGMDDDNDQQTDYPADYGCSGAGSSSEVFCATETDPTSLITTPQVTGNTSTFTNQFASTTCISTASKDAVHALVLPVPVETLDVSVGGGAWDQVIAVRDVTCGTELACADDNGSAGGEALTVSNLSPGSYAIVVDGWSSGQGSYTLTVQGTVAAGTACDSPLFASGVLTCPTGTSCSSTTAVCE